MPLPTFLPLDPTAGFPLENLPYGCFVPQGSDDPRPGTRVGDTLIDLRALAEAGLVDGIAGLAEAWRAPTLNPFMALGRPTWRAARARLQELLAADEPTLRDDAALRERALFPADAVEMRLPCEIGDYTDFYSSREHATNVGTMFRGAENALMPNWLWIPIAYHGRASSIVVSGAEVRRPLGQTKRPADAEPSFGPSRQMDFELEMGAFIGPGNALGEPVPVERAHEHLFGLALVNDWSARDIQAWEYQPLGPFLAKNLATSIAPWIVTMEALEPFRVAPPAQEPAPLPYLAEPEPTSYDIRLEVTLQAEGMADAQTIARSNFRHLYWTLAQQIAHHTVNGCNLRPGDLLASGTISGAEPDSLGSLLELTWRGERPIKLPDGRERRFLEDGDRLTLRGWCEGDGYRVAFGEVTGRILPAAER